MKNGRSHIGLERVLTAVEADILQATDRDLLSGVTTRKLAAKGIIRAKLDERSKRASIKLPDSVDDRRLLLSAIIAGPLHSSGPARLTYGSKRKVSDLEVSALLKKLLSNSVEGKKRR